MPSPSPRPRDDMPDKDSRRHSTTGSCSLGLPGRISTSRYRELTGEFDDVDVSSPHRHHPVPGCSTRRHVRREHRHAPGTADPSECKIPTPFAPVEQADRVIRVVPLRRLAALGEQRRASRETSLTVFSAISVLRDNPNYFRGQKQSTALRPLPERVIHQDERGHRLDHRHGARQHARIVAAPALERGVVQVFSPPCPARA